MKRRKILKIAAMSLLALGWFPCSAAAQSIKEQLVGAWTFVSALDVHPDGRKDDRWGANPKGVFIFDKSGRYAQFISRSDLPQVEGGRPDKGTPDENKAILSGLVASFGTYTVDESNKTVTTKVEGGAFPTYRGRAEARDTVDHRRRAEIHQPGDINGHEGRGQLEAGEVAGRTDLGFGSRTPPLLSKRGPARCKEPAQLPMARKRSAWVAQRAGAQPRALPTP